MARLRLLESTQAEASQRPTTIGMLSTSVYLVIIGVVTKLMGVAREAVVASLFGASTVTDSYVVSLQLFNLMGSSVLSPVATALIPFVAPLVASGRRQEAWDVFIGVATSTVVMLSLPVAMVAWKTPELIRLLAPGLGGESLHIATALTRVLLVGLLPFILSGLIKSALQAYQQFVLPELATTLQSVLAVVLLPVLFRSMGWISISITTLLGFLSSFLLLIVVASVTLRPGWLAIRPHLGPRKVLLVALPLFVDNIVGNVYLFADRYFASQLGPGSISYLNWADKVRQLPLALFVGPVTNVLLPTLAAATAAKDDQYTDTWVRALTTLVALLSPIAVGLALLAPPIVGAIYRRGAFDTHATEQTALALVAYAPSLVAIGVSRVNFSAFYACGRTLVPMVIGMLAALVNVALDALLVAPLHHVGIALAGTLSAFFAAFLSTAILARESGGVGSRVAGSIGRTGIATLVTAVAMIAVIRWMEGTAYLMSYDARLSSVCIVLVVGGLTYWLMSKLLGSEELTQLAGAVLRSKGSVT